MFDLSDYPTLKEAAQLTPRRPTAGALWRWARRGVRARDGRRIRLRHVRIGGRVYTTEEWLQEFFDAVTAATCAGNTPTAQYRRPAQPTTWPMPSFERWDYEYAPTRRTARPRCLRESLAGEY